MQIFHENVLANNLYPVAIIKIPGNIVTISPNKPITFDGSGSFDPDNTNIIKNYLWSVDNVVQSSGSTADKKYFTYTFTLPAGVNSKTYQIKLMVRDNEYTTNSKTITVTVHNGKGRTEYYLTDHLGSIRTTIDDQGNVIGYDDYYPFGLAMPGRSLNSGTPNDLNKFTGHERDQEGGLNLDYMLARNYDPEIGRFLSVDPLASKYPNISPYVYVANNPQNAIDPDGRLIVFINGQHTGDGNWPRSDLYWANSGYFAHAVMDRFSDYNAVFFDGAMGGVGNTIGNLGSFNRSLRTNLNATNRFDRGYQVGKKVATKLIGLLAPDEKIRIITHSMGAAYGKGFVMALMEYIQSSKDPQIRKTLISIVADFDPFQAEELQANSKIYTQQFWHDGGLFGIADAVQKGLEDNQEDKAKKSHFIKTFMGDINNLKEGEYKWNETKGEWECVNCKE